METVNEDNIDQIEKPTIGNRLEHLETLIEQLEIRIANLESAAYIPVPPLMDPSYTNKCSLCDIDFSNTMGYVCDHRACPMYPRSGSTSGPIFDHTTVKG